MLEWSATELSRAIHARKIAPSEVMAAWLSQVAAVILNHEIKKVRVEYYYTASGASAQVLAQQRAVAVAQYLFQMGVPKERLSAVSFVGYKGGKSKIVFVIAE